MLFAGKISEDYNDENVLFMVGCCLTGSEVATSIDLCNSEIKQMLRFV